MGFNQLELFQVPSPHEINIFHEAKILKKVAQDVYNNFTIASPHIKDSYAILNVNIKIEKINDNSSVVEPSSPKLFIWQFIPEVILDLGSTSKNLNEDGRFTTILTPKIIPKWILLLLTKENFSRIDFHKFTRQYFTLEIINKIFLDKTITEFLESVIEEKSLVIFSRCKLFPQKNKTFSGLLEMDMMNKIKNYLKILKKLQKSNWYFIGCYDDFIYENDLLNDLDSNEFIKNKIKEKIQASEPHTYSDLFQNDYLFLNNSEFYTLKKDHNTDGWDTFYIMSPQFLDNKLTKIDDNKLYKNSGDDERRAIYCYTKKIAGKFFRNDILFPNNKLEIQNAEQILSLAYELTDDKE
jgi:hypothetical protein